MHKSIFALLLSIFIILFSCTSESEIEEISDNLAPTLSLSIDGMANASEGGINVIGKLIVVNVAASDEERIAKIEAFINNEKVGEVTKPPYSFNIDISSLGSKTGKSETFIVYTLKIVATDLDGNTTSIEQQIHHDDGLLIKLTIPDGYQIPYIPINHFVFVSDLEGSLIDIEEISFDTREVKLYTTEEFDLEKEFTITFASLGKNGVASYLYSVSHLNRENLKQVDLKIPERFSTDNGTNYPHTGLTEHTQLQATGSNYVISPNPEGFATLFLNNYPTNEMASDAAIYFYHFDHNSFSYSYQLVNTPLAPDFEINIADFSSQNLIEKQITTMPVNFMNNSHGMMLFGFLSQEDLDNNLYHRIWLNGHGASTASSLNYLLNSQFYSYAHRLTIGNYHSKGLGLPSDNIVIPDWAIDYSFQNNTISLLKSGTGHTVGEIYLEGGYDKGMPYHWNLFFNSNKDSEVVLPSISEILQDYTFYSLYHSESLEVGRVGLRRYKNIDTYNDYLEQIIKGNNGFKRASPQYESIFSGEMVDFPILDYFYNGW